MIAKSISAFCFGIALISSLEGPVEPLLVLTQSEFGYQATHNSNGWSEKASQRPLSMSVALLP